jgi:hypothetical protein
MYSKINFYFSVIYLRPLPEDDLLLPEDELPPEDEREGAE